MMEVSKILYRLMLAQVFELELTVILAGRNDSTHR